MDVDFRPLTPADVSAATALSEAAGWEMRAADWERLVSLSEIRTVSGWVDDDLAATASVIQYGDAVAWIGSVIVATAHRRRGLGSRVFDRVFDEAEATGVDVVGLDANDTGKPIYERAGFTDVLTATVFTGTPDVDADTATIEPFSDAETVACYDSARVGVDRTFLLDSFLADDDTFGLATSDDSGYAIYSRTRTGWAVGPLLATDSETVHRLLAAISDALDGEPITVNALGKTPASTFCTAGLSHARTLTRMTYPTSEPTLTGNGVYANAGFALG